MTDKQKNNNNSESESELKQTLNKQYLEMLKMSLDKDISEIRLLIDKQAQKCSEREARINNLIETVERRTNKKLDGFDEAFRGNGKMGVFEQFRRLKTFVTILFMLILFALGFEMFGLTLERWVGGDSEETAQNKREVVEFPSIREILIPNYQEVIIPMLEEEIEKQKEEKKQSGDR